MNERLFNGGRLPWYRLLIRARPTLPSRSHRL
jgi:hypothetical protein